MKTQISLRSFAASQFRADSFLLSAFLCVPLRLCGCLLLLQSAFAATNDLTSALQKGLFEEEANRNYAAAIEAYQGVINRFDEDRKLAATAIFRVGEIYRKQGKTNEANTQYERIVREFSDQSTLATLSQSYLASSTASSINPPRNNLTSESLLTSDEAEEVKKIRALIRDSPDLINARDQNGNTRLHTAAFLGQVVVARFLVENGADVNAQNRGGWTPLNNAVNGGHKALVELCLSHGANVQTPDSDGNTALHVAARRGFRSIVELLLTHGADINAKTKSGSTPLHLAAADGFKSVAELLISHGADLNSPASVTRDSQERAFVGAPLHIAAARDDLPLAELLLAHNADSNATNSVGETPLHISAARGNQKLTELLLANKAAVDPITIRGETPLALAARGGYNSTVSVLLAHGANVNLGNPVDGDLKAWTPLLEAVNSKQKDTVSLLLKNNADPNSKSESPNFKGGTPLFLSVWQRNIDIVQSLLDAKANPNSKDNSGASPALAAMRLSEPSLRKRTLSLLLDHGAETETTDSEGKTLLMLAVEGMDKELVELLLAHKANVNAQTPFGSTPLHFIVSSANRGSYETISFAEFLLSAGADVNLQNKEGKTPLNLLQSSPKPAAPPQSDIYSKLAELLRSHGALANLPRLDVIEVRRSDANYSKVIFTKGSNGWDRFTLYELIAVEYHLLTSSPGGESRSLHPGYGGPNRDKGLGFPDFSRIRIRHPKPDFKSWNERTIDIADALTSGDCSADVSLELGDQVEIPETDHVLDAKWEGLSNEPVETLKKCLARQVSIVIKGQSKSFTLTPGTIPLEGAFSTEVIAPFWIKPVLLNSKLLLASSDLSRIKLIRTDSATGQKRELIVECRPGPPPPSVWLRDGDIIEVPDKP